MRVLVALASFGAAAAAGDTFSSADDTLLVGHLVPTASQDPRLDSNGWALVMHGVAENDGDSRLQKVLLKTIA